MKKTEIVTRGVYADAHGNMRMVTGDFPMRGEDPDGVEYVVVHREKHGLPVDVESWMTRRAFASWAKRLVEVRA